MNTFPLKIVTPDGLIFDEEARQITVRTTQGDVTILPRHMNYVSPLASGIAAVVDTAGNRREAECSGGLISVQNRAVRLIASHFTWTT